MENKNIIFALDIGTRSIIGIVCTQEDEKLKIVASEIIEHEKRTMYDGQIHDIDGVAKIVSKVKASLESQIGFQLKRVAIAAAGRALKTARGSAQMDVDFTSEVDKTSVESLELEAIQNAQSLMGETLEKPGSKYYCVGHSVSAYYLDGNYIESLIGHRGEQISVEILATFLPNIVVDSLYSVMDRVGLEVESLTLEPIAAINIAIKKNMRLLNLAMVDIGAGTCDIAVTNNGTISAYAMVPGAGDKITEAISHKYLLDFDTAEFVKRQLSSPGDITFSDIVGIENVISAQEMVSSIEDSIRDMGVQIAQEILKYNTKPPGAVFLVGGASQIPLLPQVIADELGIPAQRVAVRDSSIANEFEGIEDRLRGPDAITPLGIALEHSINAKKNFIEIVFNEKPIRMFNSKVLTVSDALVMSGFNPRNLIPRSGDEFVYSLNGSEKRLKGLPGMPAQIILNGKHASLADALSDGDEITVVSAQKGSQRKPTLYECLNLEGYDEGGILRSSIMVNSIDAKSDSTLSSGDIITVKPSGEYIPDAESKIPGDDEISDSDYSTDELEFDFDYESLDEYEHDDEFESLSPPASPENSVNIQKFMSVVVNGERIDISHSKENFILTDIFEYIDFDISKPQGFLTMSVNGSREGFNYKLKNGDVIEISWK